MSIPATATRPVRRRVPADGTCEVWTARLSATAASVGRFARLASDVERARAERFLMPRDRNRALTSFGLLRILLGRYLDQHPADVQIDRSCTCGDPHGAPRLIGTDAVRVSVSHSGDVIVYAVTSGQTVGVDVEAPRTADELPPTQHLLDLALRTGERRRVASLPAHRRWPALLRYWTAKEAVLKSVGIGLSIEPTAAILEDPGVAHWAQLLHPFGGHVPVWVSPLHVAAGYTAALASSRDFRTVEVRPFAELSRPTPPSTPPRQTRRTP